MVKKIAVVALKGGVGESSLANGLINGLAEKGFKVGGLDIVVTRSNLYSALGRDHSPKRGLDSIGEKVVVPTS